MRQDISENSDDVLLSMRGITKRFPGVTALHEVDFTLRRGEVVALLGANGAGKSTLMKILSGVYQADEGDIVLSGKKVSFRLPVHAYRAGISVVYQETSLIPALSVVQNIFLGREPKSALGVLDEKRMLAEYEAVRSRFALDIPPEKKVRDLGAAQKKLVEIMKAVSCKCGILIMDEPTDALSRHEAERLFEVVRELKSKGMSVVFITHFLEEVNSIADSATILRDGTVVASRRSPSTPVKNIVALMLGREAVGRPVLVDASNDSIALSVSGLGRRKEFDRVSFFVRQGEVLGITGVVGSGKTELARVLAGAAPSHTGAIHVKGAPVRFGSPLDAVRAGIGMAPEDRKTDGLILEHDILKNISLASLGSMSTMGVISRKKEYAQCVEAASALSVRYMDAGQRIKNLSGGNQQKCVLARWFLTSPDVLILDEPTRGIDVGAKVEIYGIVRSLAAQGKSVVYFTGDPEELLAVADRVIVMQKGRVKKTYETPPSEDVLLKEMIEVTNE